VTGWVTSRQTGLQETGDRRFSRLQPPAGPPRHSGLGGAALHSVAVYWTEEGAGAVRKVAK